MYLENTIQTSTNRPSIFKYVINNIKSNNNGRTFYISIPEKSEKMDLLFLFHGGGEEAYTVKNEKGALNYTELYKSEAIVVSFQGQDSNNGHSWENAFPWLKIPIKNDVSFVEEVYEMIVKEKKIRKEINLTGKSDGAGFCFYLDLHSSLPISKIGVCSGAHFILNNTTDFSIYEKAKQKATPKFLIHGTSDQVMPFEGQHFTNSHAKKKATYWKKKDKKMSNTYTANIISFFQFFSDPRCTRDYDFSVMTHKGETTKSTIFKSINNVSLVKVKQQNHTWQGHTNSGPESDSIYNKQFDATVVLCKFFNIRLNSDYSYLLETPVFYSQKVSSIRSTLCNQL